MVFRNGGAVKSNTIAFINYNFLISANAAKPMLHIWPINSQEQVQGSRLVTPGKVNALAVSSDGNYCLCGIAELVYIWHLPTGKMLASLSSHFQTVTQVRFTDDDSYVISAGQDGMIMVWSLADVLSARNNEANRLNPKYTYSDHSLPVTGLKVGMGGGRAMLYSVSMDRTCRLYDLAQGQQSLVLMFENPLTAIAVDRMESMVFVGTNEGDVLCFNLNPAPRTLEYHLEEKDLNQRYKGHTGPITCISLSMDNETMLSGGQDGNLIIWHITSKQILKTIVHKGAVTNAFFNITPPNMFRSDQKLQLISNSFERILTSNMADVPIRVVVKEPLKRPQAASIIPSAALSTKKSDQDEIQRLNLQLKAFQQANEKLFKHYVEQKLQ